MAEENVKRETRTDIALLELTGAIYSTTLIGYLNKHPYFLKAYFSIGLIRMQYNHSSHCNFLSGEKFDFRKQKKIENEKLE